MYCYGKTGKTVLKNALKHKQHIGITNICKEIFLKIKELIPSDSGCNISKKKQ